jgi:hypothetical protein
LPERVSTSGLTITCHLTPVTGRRFDHSVTAPLSTCRSTTAPRARVNRTRRYVDLGVDRTLVAPPGMDPDSLKAGLGKFADSVMTKV